MNDAEVLCSAYSVKICCHGSNGSDRYNKKYFADRCNRIFRKRNGSV